eukprot:4394799-Alexandrium_andersonii.AAC.1
MSASLVGSEMCIRDSSRATALWGWASPSQPVEAQLVGAPSVVARPGQGGGGGAVVVAKWWLWE